MMTINELIVTLLFLFAGLLLLGLLAAFYEHTKIGRSFINWVGKNIFYTDLEADYDDDDYFEDEEEDCARNFFSVFRIREN